METFIFITVLLGLLLACRVVVKARRPFWPVLVLVLTAVFFAVGFWGEKAMEDGTREPLAMLPLMPYARTAVYNTLVFFATGSLLGLLAGAGMRTARRLAPKRSQSETHS